MIGALREDGGVEAGQTRMLTAEDGVAISAVHVPAVPDHRDVCLVVVHGFTGSWREDRVQRVIERLHAFGGIVAIDLRGHGASGGQTTVGDEEVHEVAAGVAWAGGLG